MTNFMIIGAYTQGFINRRKKAVPMKEAENSTDAKVPDVMDPKNTRRILPCCEHAYLIEIAKGQLIDDGFHPIPSSNSSYSILGEKFMNISWSPNRYAQYLYVIIKIENQSLTKEEARFYDYVSALPTNGPVIINCIICRVSSVKLKAAMAGKDVTMVLW